MKCFRFIAAERASFPISLLCRAGRLPPGLPRLGGPNAVRPDVTDAWLTTRIRRCTRRAGTATERGESTSSCVDRVRVGRKRIERLMRAAGLLSRSRALVDGRAYLYALGGVCFHCLTGQPPYVRETEVALHRGARGCTGPLKSAGPLQMISHDSLERFWDLKLRHMAAVENDQPTTH